MGTTNGWSYRILELSEVRVNQIFIRKYSRKQKRPKKIVPDNASLNYLMFELPEGNCINDSNQKEFTQPSNKKWRGINKLIFR